MTLDELILVVIFGAYVWLMFQVVAWAERGFAVVGL